MQIQSLSTASTNAVINGFSNEPETARVKAIPADASNSPALRSQAESKAAAATQEEVKNAVGKLNTVASALGQSIQFSVDTDTKQNIVKLVDRESNKVIRQIPTEEAVSIAKAIDRFQGLLIKDKA